MDEGVPVSEPLDDVLYIRYLRGKMDERERIKKILEEELDLYISEDGSRLLERLIRGVNACAS
jgi:hypothetical protein